MSQYVLGWLRKKLNEKKIPSKAPALDRVLKIGEREQDLFKRAIQLYIFVHHVPHKTLESELREQLRHTGNAVFSLLLNWLRDGKPSLEYMDFLNGKINELRELKPDQLKGLEIMPSEIHLIELQDEVRLKFADEQTKTRLWFRFVKDGGLCYFVITD